MHVEFKKHEEASNGGVGKLEQSIWASPPHSPLSLETQPQVAARNTKLVQLIMKLFHLSL